MAAATQDGHADNTSSAFPRCMKSVNRITKLPVVDSTIQTASSLYGKVKDYNRLTNWTVSTAEGAVYTAVKVGMPVATPIFHNLERPIQKIDGLLCNSLDYVEDKVPAIKLQPNEMILQIYESTKDYVNNTVTPAVKNAKAYAEPAISYVEPAVKSAKEFIQPAVEKAYHVMEPTIEKAMHIVEPLVQPALDKVHNITENVKHKVDEFLWPHNHEGEDMECTECQKVRDEAERKKREKEQNENKDQEKAQPEEVESEQQEQPEDETPQEDQHQEEQQQQEDQPQENQENQEQH